MQRIHIIKYMQYLTLDMLSLLRKNLVARDTIFSHVEFYDQSESHISLHYKISICDWLKAPFMNG